MANKNKPAEAPNEAAPEVETNAAAAVNAAADAPKGEAKSIVPAKYAGRYKNGGVEGPLTSFLLAQCAKDSKPENFEFPAFFSIARANGIDEAKVAHYEQQVAEKTQGANGRARMTLSNMLRAIARKNGELVGLDGNKHPVPEAKVAVSGAAAKAQENAAPATEEVAGEQTAEATE